MWTMWTICGPLSNLPQISMWTAWSTWSTCPNRNPEGAVEKITRKTWLGCYKKTREWEDKMSDRDDNFVAAAPEALLEAGVDEELEEEVGDDSEEDEE